MKLLVSLFAIAEGNLWERLREGERGEEREREREREREKERERKREREGGGRREIASSVLNVLPVD